MNHPKWVFKTFQGDVTPVRQDLVLSDNDINITEKMETCILNLAATLPMWNTNPSPFFQENNQPSFFTQKYFPMKNETSATHISILFEKIEISQQIGEIRMDCQGFLIQKIFPQSRNVVFL